jgi:hypothetical protein
MTSQEKQEVLARLAATETASAIAREIGRSAVSDEALACFRIMEELKIPAPQVATVYKKMVAHLQQSDLTINFRIDDFFNRPIRGNRIINTWETDNDEPGYLDSRNIVEERLFNYSNNPPRTKKDKNELPFGTLTRMRLFGSRTSNPFFKPGMRPKYGALNFANIEEGPARRYGSSYFVLKDYMKHNSTFFPSDSFQASTNSSELMANYFDLHRIILHMAPKMLEALYKAVSEIEVTNLNPGEYIEAQMHSDVIFSRDIKTIYISKFDSMKVPQGSKILRDITTFAHINNIRLVHNA